MLLYRILLKRLNRSRHKIITRGLKVCKESVPVIHLRNIGIVAHIDAGKTTVSERLLYLTGATNSIGNVDTGDTITDFMDLERERGITIQSAAVSSLWRQHRINLIDTPGHVDFTAEVERSLRVLDGVVTVLDGSVGVQAQTLTVWRQSKKFQHPAVFFVNKLDKMNSDFDFSLETIENRLNMPVCAITMPLFEEDEKFTTLIDLIHRRSLNILDEKAKWIPIKENTHEFEEMCKGIEVLYSKVADCNESFAEKVLSEENLLKISPDDLNSAIRKSTLARKISPVACGSALRSTQSVVPVLDMIVDYLPSPEERKYKLPNADLCALVFKISHDPKKGRLGYIRVYKGELDNSAIFNVNRKAEETNIQVFTPYSDELDYSRTVPAGNIAVVSGLKNTFSGDTLIKFEDKSKLVAIKQDSMELAKYRLKGIQIPDPVFFCAVEAPNVGAMNQFNKALEELTIEDPSLRVREDKDSGQTIMEGMGGLHMEVIKERLRREYNLDVFMGPLMVNYKEVLIEKASASYMMSEIYEANKEQFCEIGLELEPSETPFDSVVNVGRDKDNRRHEWITAITEGCKNALYRGPLIGAPVSYLGITLKFFKPSGNRLSTSLISACATKCVREALSQAILAIVEPLMLIEVTIFEAKEGSIGLVKNVLEEHQAEILKIDSPDGNHKVAVVRGKIALAQTPELSHKIRRVTSGMGHFHLEFVGYEQVQEGTRAKLIREFA